MAKNGLKTPTEHTRYYGDFRGVDFSSDHTNVHDQRFAYAINMYKDYRAGEGNAVETIPGYRRRFEAPRTKNADGTVTFDKINGIHYYDSINPDGTRDKDIIVHAGKNLYLWDSYPNSVNTLNKISAFVPYMEINIKNLIPALHEIESITINNQILKNTEDTTYFTYVSGILFLNRENTERPTSSKITINYKTIAQNLMEESIDIINELAPIELPFKFSHISSVESIDYGKADDFTVEDGKLKLGHSWWKYRGLPFVINYYESEITQDNAIFTDMADNESKSFAFDNKLFITDGANYLALYKDENEEIVVRPVEDIAYIPTTYRNLTLGDIAPEELNKLEYEQKNLLSNYYKHTYIAHGEPGYPIYDNDFDPDEITATVYGEDAKVTFDKNTGKLVFTDPSTLPKKPEDVGKPSTYAGVEIKFKKKESTASLIKKCTVFATFDNRVFATGNPKYPNKLWYCGIDDDGRENATYFRQLDYVVDGVENAPITGLIPVADTLAALKNHARQDGSVYFHQRYETNEDVISEAAQSFAARALRRSSRSISTSGVTRSRPAPAADFSSFRPSTSNA